MTEEKYVDEIINTYEVVVWSKSFCPYCKKTKELFKKLNVEFHAIELDQVDNGEKIQVVLKAKSGQSSVPNVFIKKQHIGGCDDTHAKEKDGSLQKLLALGTESTTSVPVLTAEDLEDSEDDEPVESFQISRTRGVSILATAELPQSELDTINVQYREGMGSVAPKALTKEDLEDSEDGDDDPVESFQVSRTRGVSALQTTEFNESELDTINTQYRHGMGSITEKVFTNEDLEDSDDDNVDPVESFQVSRIRGVSALETAELDVSELNSINAHYRQGMQTVTETDSSLDMTSSSSSSSSKIYFNPFKLQGLQSMIFMFLDVFDFNVVHQVCKQWKETSIMIQKKIFSVDEKQNKILTLRGVWRGSAETVYYCKIYLQLQPETLKSTTTTPTTTTTTTITATTTTNQKQSSESLPEKVNVKGHIKWMCAKAPRACHFIEFVDDQLAELEFMQGTFCFSTRLLEMKGYCRSGCFKPGIDPEPIYGEDHQCSLKCICSHYTNCTYPDTHYTRCKNCHHKLSEHKNPNIFLKHTIACDQYKMHIPHIAKRFEAKSRGHHGRWDARFQCIRDFPHHTEEDTWKW